jgi:hypothetical protein
MFTICIVSPITSPELGFGFGCGEIIWPALLLGPELLIVSTSMNLQLDLVGVHNLLTAVLALFWGREV